jgi:hypothetical protein
MVGGVELSCPTLLQHAGVEVPPYPEYPVHFSVLLQLAVAIPAIIEISLAKATCSIPIIHNAH